MIEKKPKLALALFALTGLGSLVCIAGIHAKRQRLLAQTVSQ